MVSIQITDKWICVSRRLRQFTLVYMQIVFLLQEDAIYVFGGTCVVCPTVCFIPDKKAGNASAPVCPPAQLGVTTQIHAQALHICLYLSLNLSTSDSLLLLFSPGDSHMNAP